MERVASNFDFSILEKTLFTLDTDHSGTALNRIKTQLNTFFVKTRCKEVLYTQNTDKLFFGLRVYPILDGNKAIELLGDSDSNTFEGYYLEIDSKLLDPMLYLDGRELVALIIHEIGHIVYDTMTIQEVKNQIDMYFARSNEYVDINASKGYKELLAYAIKDAVMKVGSVFSKTGNTEMVADAFVVACGYGPELESAIKKIVKSLSYMAQDVDDRFIALSWVLRLGREFSILRIPAIKTLNKAAQLTGSNLEKKELKYASRIMSTMNEPINESALDNLKARFSKKFMEFKAKGVRAIKNDVYELNLRLRCADDQDELMSIIRTINSDIAILQDYLTEDIPDEERQDIIETLQELYDIRQKAAKDKTVKDRYSGYIQVIYPSI